MESSDLGHDSTGNSGKARCLRTRLAGGGYLMGGKVGTPVTIPGYRLLELIASGSSGAVWKAMQEDLSRPVAVKVLAPGLFDASETRARFLREAKLQASLSHPALLRIFDAGFSGNHPYLVMEYVDGGTLRDVIRDQAPLDVSRAIRLGADAASALAHAHQAAIIHRDLKPENILTTRDGAIKIADFGLAKSLMHHGTLKTEADRIMGTPGYIAPEILLGQEAGTASDIYSIGVILHELLTGLNPFASRDVASTLQAQLRRVPATLGSQNSAVPRDLDDLVRFCLDRSPEQRPGSASELASRLAAMESQRSSPASDPAALPEMTVVPEAAIQTLAGRRPATRLPARPSLPTVAARKSAPGVARSRLPVGAFLGAGLVLALAVLGAMATLLPEAPRSSESPATSQPPGEPGTELMASSDQPTVPFPRVVRLATGDREVHLYLAGSAPRRSLLQYNEEGTPQVRQVTFEAGGTHRMLRGLLPGRSYQLTLTSEGVQVSHRFRTRSSYLDGTQVRLVSGDRRLLKLEATVREDRIGVIWIRKTSGGVEDLACMESLDGGVTWSEAGRVPVELSGAGRPAIGSTDDSLIMPSRASRRARST